MFVLGWDFPMDFPLKKPSRSIQLLGTMELQVWCWQLGQEPTGEVGQQGAAGPTPNGFADHYPY
jgi:hypothetical protein